MLNEKNQQKDFTTKVNEFSRKWFRNSFYLVAFICVCLTSDKCLGDANRVLISQYNNYRQNPGTSKGSANTPSAPPSQPGQYTQQKPSQYPTQINNGNRQAPENKKYEIDLKKAKDELKRGDKNLEQSRGSHRFGFSIPYLLSNSSYTADVTVPILGTTSTSAKLGSATGVEPFYRFIHLGYHLGLDLRYRLMPIKPENTNTTDTLEAITIDPFLIYPTSAGLGYTCSLSYSILTYKPTNFSYFTYKKSAYNGTAYGLVLGSYYNFSPKWEGIFQVAYRSGKVQNIEFTAGSFSGSQNLSATLYELNLGVAYVF